jgi:cell division protein FtsL
MPNGGISLLPEEMRRKEEEELEKKEKPGKEKHKLFVPGRERGQQGAEDFDLDELPKPRPSEDDSAERPPVKPKKPEKIIPYKPRPAGAPPAPKPAKQEPKRSLRVSLIPEEKKERKLNVSRRKIFLGAIVAVEIILVAASAFFVWNMTRAKQAEIEKIEQDISRVQNQLQELKKEEAELYIFEKKIESVEGLLAGHIHQNKVFGFLEKNTLKDVWYESYIASSDGKVNLSVNAKDMMRAARQIAQFHLQDELTNVDVNNFQASTDDLGRVTGAGFDLQLIFTEGYLLDQDNQN